MRQAKFRSTLGFMFGELAKVVVETSRRTAIETSPERRLADGLATGSRHSDIIIRDPADHVRMRLNVFHKPSIVLESVRLGLAVRFGPGPARSLGSSCWNWFSRWVAQGAQNTFGAIRLIFF